MRRLTLALSLSLALAASAEAQTSTPNSRFQAAEAVVDLVYSDATIQQFQEAMLAQALGQDAELVLFKDIMADVFNKALRSSSFRTKMASLYADVFSESELLELAAFYRTPLGLRMIEETPRLSLREGAIGEEAVAPLLPEMERRMIERAADPAIEKRLRALQGPPPPARRGGS